MSRVASLLLAGWLTVMGAPALACASAAADCCPDGGTIPCPNDPGARAACCVEAPAPAQATSYACPRVDPADVDHPGWDEPSIPPFLIDAPAQAVVWSEEPFLPPASCALDASLTYLRTQRLRL
ncbi:MAG TPA: hypothetical protein VJL86_10340 [Steroidobacteraceae bacterium]|nr:hypothetical protein [Steroidobacteraceae bacterium]